MRVQRSEHLFFSNQTPTTDTHTLSLHDALPISPREASCIRRAWMMAPDVAAHGFPSETGRHSAVRSEEHTSELQSLRHLVCRLLLEKIHTPLVDHDGHARISSRDADAIPLHRDV